MSVEAVIDFLRRYATGRVALVGHQRPDGDALGSCLGLAHVLASLGCRARVVNLSPLQPRLYFLACDLLVSYDTPDWHTEYDCVGVLDCGDASRVDGINQPALAALPVFNIDHHVSSSGLGQARWVEPEASSVGEMVVRLCREAGWALNREAADALWTAIVTDTGRFSFENTTSRCLEAALDCVVAGARPADIAAHVYQSVTIEERRLQAKALGRMEFYEGGRMASTWLRQEDFIEAGAGVASASELINLLRDTEGVEVAVFFYETPSETPGSSAGVKVSMRTLSPHNALAVAAKFNGGGHKRAAGCTVAGTVEEVKSRVLSMARHAYFQSEPQ